MTDKEVLVDGKEFITRSLNTNWVVDGIIGPTAFDWSKDETYLSVNRKSVDTYKADLTDFANSHQSFLFDNNGKHEVLAAEMKVGNVNNIRFKKDNNQLSVELPVIVRDKHYKSHAGIFAKSDGKNLNRNLSSVVEPAELGVSANAILQELRLKLRNISTLKHVALLQN